MVQIAKDEPGEAAGYRWRKAAEVVDVPEHIASTLLIIPGFRLIGRESPIDQAATVTVDEPVPGSTAVKRTLIHEAVDEDEHQARWDARLSGEVDDAESDEEIEQT